MPMRAAPAVRWLQISPLIRPSTNHDNALQLCN
jgi:hypothetical protein